MSQSRPNKGTGGSGNRQSAGSQKAAANSGGSRSASGAPSRRPAAQASSTAAGRGGANRPPVKRAGAAPPPSGFRTQIDRTLPPFTVQRYIAIWAAVIIPIAIVLFFILRPAAVANNAAGGDCQAPAGAGKYMVISTAKGCIVAKLYTDAAAGVPKTIANFEDKANKGFFNGLVFHRVENWVIQGGDPAGTGAGGGKMPSEYNTLPFKVGALGVARGGDKALNSDSQFFIVKAAADSLNGDYTNFGEVVSGMDVVNKIAIGDKMTKVTIGGK